jgi:hypothetical protein
MKEIYIARGDKQIGPFSKEQIIEMLSTGVLSNKDKAWTNGMADWTNLEKVLADKDPSTAASAPPIPEPPAAEPINFQSEDESPVFYPLSLTRFLFWTLATHGLFLNYWSYRNWKYIRNSTRPRIHAELRGIFWIWFVYQLAKEIKCKTNRYNEKIGVFYPGLIVSIFIVLWVVSKYVRFGGFPAVLSSLILLTIQFLVLKPVLKRILALNNPNINWDAKDIWSNGKTLCLMFGIPIYIAELFLFRIM